MISDGTYRNLAVAARAVLLVCLLSSCEKPAQPAYQPVFSADVGQAKKEYVLGIHPLHNPARLFELYGPVVDQINARIPEAHFRLEASSDYAQFDEKLYGGRFDVAMPNPYQTVLSLRHGYRVIGKMGDDDNFRGVILVRKDAHVKQVADLKGRMVSYPAPTALAATMMPQYYLQTHGLDVAHDITKLYVGSQESSIMNVYLGKVAAGATWPIPWKAFSKEHPDMAQQMEAKWVTEPLLNNAWVVRRDFPSDLADKVIATLVELGDSAQGRQILARLPISGFEAANDATYEPVRRYLDMFAQTVRPIER